MLWCRLCWHLVLSPLLPPSSSSSLPPSTNEHPPTNCHQPTLNCVAGAELGSLQEVGCTPCYTMVLLLGRRRSAGTICVAGAALQTNQPQTTHHQQPTINQPPTTNRAPTSSARDRSSDPEVRHVVYASVHQCDCASSYAYVVDRALRQGLREGATTGL